MADARTVLYEVRDRIAYITLNRPEKKNAINRAMRKELGVAYMDVKYNPEVWVAIITGNGDRVHLRDGPERKRRRRKPAKS